jgi:hypothetical protein
VELGNLLTQAVGAKTLFSTSSSEIRFFSVTSALSVDLISPGKAAVSGRLAVDLESWWSRLHSVARASGLSIRRYGAPDLPFAWEDCINSTGRFSCRTIAIFEPG